MDRAEEVNGNCTFATTAAQHCTSAYHDHRCKFCGDNKTKLVYLEHAHGEERYHHHQPALVAPSHQLQGPRQRF
jgi:hypothetical protein